jgi:transcriptional regulator
MIAVIKASDARRKRVLAMRQRKMTFEAIAAELGVTRQRAYAIHREAKAAAQRRVLTGRNGG